MGKDFECADLSASNLANGKKKEQIATTVRYGVSRLSFFSLICVRGDEGGGQCGKRVETVTSRDT